MEVDDFLDNEESRLQELLKYDVLDTPQEEDFDNIVQLACQSCQSPMALITLLDDCRQWFKARVGVRFRETAKDIAFCAYTIQGNDVLVIEDTHLDPRFIHNSLVTGEPYVRFYAGVPLQTPAGYNIGSLCVLDTTPRSISPEQLFSLKTLARYVVQLLELRYKNKRLTNVWDEFAEWQAESERQHRVFTTAHIAAKVGVYEFDLQQDVLRISSGFCKIFGWKEDREYSCKDFMQLVHSDDRDAVEQEYATCLRHDKRFILEYRCLVKNGQKVLHISCSGEIIRDEEQKPIRIIGVMQDISEQKEYERQLEAQNQELTKLNQELDNFVYRVSHDMRAPMTSVLGLIELILCYEKEPEKVNEMLFLIRKSLLKQDKFIRDILDYSRNARLELKLEVVDLEELVTESFSQLAAFADGGELKLEVSVKGKVPLVSDQYRLGVILGNLISNAIKYRNQRSQEQGWVRVEAQVQEQQAVLIVKDNGMGIAREHQAKVFDMFYRATDFQPGSGLGLYIVKEAVSKLGGTIELSSQEKVGTNITITLPNRPVASEVVAAHIK